MSQLLTDVRSAGGGADGRPLLLTDSWSVAAPLINATGQDVLTDGGYSGQAEVFTAAQIQALIASGEVHLVVVKDHAAQTDPVRQAVSDSSCTTVRSWASAAGEGPSEVGGDAAQARDGHDPSQDGSWRDAASDGSWRGASSDGSSRDAASDQSRGGAPQALGFTLYTCS